MITATPIRQIAAPSRPDRSGWKPSKATPQSSDPTMNTPPDAPTTHPNSWLGWKAAMTPYALRGPWHRARRTRCPCGPCFRPTPSRHRRPRRCIQRHRRYRPEVLHRLSIIDVAQRAGLSPEEIAPLTAPENRRADTSTHIRTLADDKLPHIDAQITPRPGRQALAPGRTALRLRKHRGVRPVRRPHAAASAGEIDLDLRHVRRRCPEALDLNTTSTCTLSRHRDRRRGRPPRLRNPRGRRRRHLRARALDETQ